MPSGLCERMIVGSRFVDIASLIPPFGFRVHRPRDCATYCCECIAGRLMKVRQHGDRIPVELGGQVRNWRIDLYELEMMRLEPDGINEQKDEQSEDCRQYLIREQKG